MAAVRFEQHHAQAARGRWRRLAIRALGSAACASGILAALTVPVFDSNAHLFDLLTRHFGIGLPTAVVATTGAAVHLACDFATD